MRRAQTATEYLIILAVVIIVAIVVMSVLGVIPGMGGDAGGRAALAQLQAEKIGVQSYSVTPNGTFVFLRNNHYEMIRIENITINNIPCTKTNPRLPITLDIAQQRTVFCFDVTNSNVGELYDYSLEILWIDLSSGGRYNLKYRSNLVGRVAEATEGSVPEDLDVQDQENGEENNEENGEGSNGGESGELEPFTFQIETTEENQEFRFVIENAENMYVNWGAGDGWEPLSNGSFIRIKEYESMGVYNVSLTGNASEIRFGGGHVHGPLTPNLLKDILTPLENSIDNLNSAQDMFRDTAVVTFSAENFFDGVSGSIGNMLNMFLQSQFNGDISGWDTSNVTSMGSMFANSQFNGDISGWDTSNVTSMGSMFANSQFNGDISGWNTSSVEFMNVMFQNSQFDGDISGWDTSNVTSMSGMFQNSQFNGNISGWNTSSVEFMNNMFMLSPFNQNISSWCVSLIDQKPSFFDLGSGFQGQDDLQPNWGAPCS